MSIERIHSHFTEARQTLDRFLESPDNLERIRQAGIAMSDSLRHGGKIMSCGNGGSHCDAMHFAEELSGRYRDNRPALAAMAISDVSHMSCVGNDYGFEFVFSRVVEALGREGDVLVAISTSGPEATYLKPIERPCSRKRSNSAGST